MKNVLFILLLILPYIFISQTCSGYEIPGSSIQYCKQGNINNIMAGSCASPDGPVNIIASAPGSYAILLASGYCYTIGPQKNFSMCFNFTLPAGATTATLNSGYSSTGCGSISFAGFNLYTCAPGCTFVGTGLTFSGLTPGSCYTWCFSGTCTGPGPGFDHVCPYFMTTSTLPIELIKFEVEKSINCNILKWSTATETNSEKFQILRSTDATNFNYITEVAAAGESNTLRNYSVEDCNPAKSINYYRLNEIDRDKSNQLSNIIAVDNSYLKEQPIRATNVLGQNVNLDYPGIKFIFYQNGTVIKAD